jgi:hypothetical protein
MYPDRETLLQNYTLQEAKRNFKRTDSPIDTFGTMSETSTRQIDKVLKSKKSTSGKPDCKQPTPRKQTNAGTTIQPQNPPDDTRTGRENGEDKERKEPDRRDRSFGHCLVQSSPFKTKKPASAPQNADSRDGRWKETERKVNEAWKAEIDLPAFLPRLVSRELREQTMQTYPILREHNGHRAFFLYVMNTPNRDDEEHWGTGKPVIPWKKVARCYGKEAQNYGTNLRIPRILEMYQDQVVPDSEFSEYHSNGHARVVRETGVDPSLEEAWREDQESDRRNADLVDFFTGNKHDAKRRHDLRQRRIAACSASEARCSDGRKWRRYLHNRDSSNYYSLLKHMPDAKARANQIEAYIQS